MLSSSEGFSLFVKISDKGIMMVAYYYVKTVMMYKWMIYWLIGV